MSTAVAMPQALKKGGRGKIKAIIVLKDSKQASEEEIIAHCRQNLAAYKVPRIVEFRAELPKTNVGEILRRALREETLRSK
ncbi:acyl-CoA synthetase (AMP-forming)/AMP-acid ligase II [Saccharococcus thermophilus]|uniref:Acyl-CoA synthetase (AMP-forming)/AMP-acid ligase II n=1 Tax=Saccharococcus thermophilus TaxID=29396 RepID=A0A846MJY0_9BACL|nr:acyl-CoA synthetase (AMP-forming)/AMP-acid ligase II [Saccharococcus thermophilus]